MLLSPPASVPSCRIGISQLDPGEPSVRETSRICLPCGLVREPLLTQASLLSPHPPHPHLVSHTLSGFWSPPARLTHRLSKEKAKKKKKKEKGREKKREKKKAIPSQDACALSLKGWRTVLAAAVQPTAPAEVERMPRHCGARSVGSCLSTLSGQLDRAHLA